MMIAAIEHATENRDIETGINQVRNAVILFST